MVDCAATHAEAYAHITGTPIDGVWRSRPACTTDGSPGPGRLRYRSCDPGASVMLIHAGAWSRKLCPHEARSASVRSSKLAPVSEIVGAPSATEAGWEPPPGQNARPVSAEGHERRLAVPYSTGGMTDETYEQTANSIAADWHARSYNPEPRSAPVAAPHAERQRAARHRTSRPLDIANSRPRHRRAGQPPTLPSHSWSGVPWHVHSITFAPLAVEPLATLRQN